MKFTTILTERVGAAVYRAVKRQGCFALQVRVAGSHRYDDIPNAAYTDWHDANLAFWQIVHHARVLDMMHGLRARRRAS